MTDLEISKALALAIGYLPEHVRVWGAGSPNYHNGEGVAKVFRHDGVYGVERTDANHLWSTFGYRDWNVIGPIAEKFDYFPTLYSAGWRVRFTKEWGFADAPQKAIALAVIGSKK
jgi:hypothetical protein